MTEPGVIWNQRCAVEYFLKRRNEPGDLYHSEIQLLPRMLVPGIRILDVGCATGGLLAALSHYQPDFDYVGFDCSSLMVAEARKRFPRYRFEIGDASRLPFADRSFDLVICTGGTLVTNLGWRQIIHECWRVTKDKFLFDLRVVADGENLEDMSRSSVRLAFGKDKDDAPVAPYVIINAITCYEAVMALPPPLAHVWGVGYDHAVSEMATTPYDEVCMLQVCLAKQQTEHVAALQWDAPFPWPGQSPDGSV